LVRLFLTGEAAGGPGEGLEALLADRFLAVDTEAIGAGLEAAEGRADFAEDAGVPIDAADGEIAFGGGLDFIHLVRAGVDGEALARAGGPSEFGLFLS